MTQFLAQFFYPISGVLTAVLIVGIAGVMAKKDSLPWRFVVILSTLLLAGLVAYQTPPRLGIDLAGGTSLTYELDLSKVPETSHAGNGELAARVIEVLKKRVDPAGQKNIIWRVLNGKRIQIQMPLADAATREARRAEQAAEEELQKSSLKQAEVLSAIAKPAAEREGAILALPGVTAGSEQYQLITALAGANDALEKVKAEELKYDVDKVPADVREAKLTAQKNYADALAKLTSSNVDMAQLKRLIQAADNTKNEAAQRELAALPANFPRQRPLIEQLIAAHKRVMALSGGGVDDPAELQRLVTAAGVLDFRIAVVPGELSKDEDEAAIQSLEKNGPDRAVTVGGARARWFEIDVNSRDNFRLGGYVMMPWGGQMYLLCYDDSLRSLTHGDTSRRQWAVAAGAPYSDPQQGGALVLPFRMDAVGAKYMGELTGNNKSHPMAILLDDRAITAPNINQQITESGIIIFGSPSAERPVESIRKEAEQLKQIMDAGSLPATLQSNPISVVEITPDMGKDNIERGVRSAYYAVIAVVLFMCVYYTITGVFADLALMLNLLLVLAAMAIFRGTFTLPGIAGLVLTLGMAVDANVLINERIREEIHKGASLWMAIKQGYDKVFWTIFDANLTTSLTSVVLIYFGSEEVKGFGVTLLIGLIIHMFTALFVTRTLMMAAVRWGILRAIDDHSIAEYLKEIFTFTWLRNGHFPFMRVITVSNIDWIGKRHLFWGVSAVITLAGLAAFVLRGDDKYDIEFRGGTQVTFAIKPDAAGKYLTLDEVRGRIEGMASQPGLKDLRSARVYGVGSAGNRFEMQTTIKNPEGNSKYVNETLLDPLAKTFADVLEATPRLRVAHDDLDEKQIGRLIDDGVVRPVTAGSLDQVFAKTALAGMPNRDVTAYKNGAAVVLDQIAPPQTAAQLRERIQNTRQSASVRAPYRDFQIIPVTAADGSPAAEEDPRPLTRAVMVTVDPAVAYDENKESEWQTRVAQTEWQVLRTALTNESRFDGVTTFDAVVADQAKQQAMLSVALSLALIVVYVWIRFGGIRYGVGAILSLAHDAVVAVAATVLSGVVYQHVFGGHPNWLLLSDFKINLTMIAAYLTIIGYSVNDTIVIFDRVRELRGRSQAPLSAKLINDAINQCFGRTIWTTFTVFIVVLIMYIWGGEGVRGFSFAMLVGVFTGAYSTLAIASPMLLATAKAGDVAGPAGGPRRQNPFLKKDGAPAPAAAPVLRQSDVAPGNA
jgi:SecD/SecF fusion protein